MFSQWAQKRVCRFLLKRLFGPIIRGDHLDSEHFEVQLRSGTIQLNDLILNTNYLNEQLADPAITIKEGSIGSLTLNLPWKTSTSEEQCEIEVNEIELIFTVATAACKACSKTHSTVSESSTSQEAQGNGLDSDFTSSRSVQAFTYMGVHDGVQMIAKMVEKVLLGLRVRIKKILIAFEGISPEDKDSTQSSNSISHRMLVMRLEYMDYGLEPPSVFQEPSGLVETFISDLPVVKIIRFSNATVEVLDVFSQNNECFACPVLGSQGDVGKVFGQPVPVVLGNGGLVSGSIQLSMPWKIDCMEIPKLNAEIAISSLKIRVSVYVIEQLLSLFQSLEKSRQFCHISSDKDEGINLNSHGKLQSTNNHKEQSIPVGSVSSHSFSQACQRNLANPTVLPVRRLISDWMTSADNATQKKDGLAESDLEASVDEFFECFDETRSSQVSLAGSGLWTWTCSAFSAITTTSSLASGSAVIPQARPVECDMKLKLHGITVQLILKDLSANKIDSILTQKCKTKTDFSSTGQSSMSRSGLTFDLLNIANESTSDFVPGAPDMESQFGGGMEMDGEDGYLDACFSDIDISLQVSNCLWQSKLTVQKIEIVGHLPEATEDTWFSEADSAWHIQMISCINGPLQGLVENALPAFPVSLCHLRGTDSGKRDNINESVGCYIGSETFPLEGNVFNKKSFSRPLLRLWNVGSDPAFQMALRWELTHVDNVEIVNSYSQTHVELCFQPGVLWLDGHVLNMLLKLLDRCSSSFYKNPSLSGADHVIDNIMHPRNMVQINVCIPCMRIVFCFPFEDKKNLLKDHFLCMDFHGLSSVTKITSPFFSHKFHSDLKSEIKYPVGDSVNIACSNGSLYLISTFRVLEKFRFNAHKVIEISSAAHGSPSVDIRCTMESEGGIWIAQHVWDGVSMQQKRGDGANSVGRRTEFAAVMSSQEIDERNSCVREDIIACSPYVIHVILPKLTLDLSVSQHLLVISLIDLFLNSLLIKNNQEGSDNETEVQNYFLEMEKRGSKIAQTSILVDANSIEIVLHPRSHQAEEMSQSVGKGKSSWNKFRFDVQNFRLLSVSKLGMIDCASYIWLSHEDAHGWGFLDETCEREHLLLSCRSDALGRGDGGGGNALATGSAGTEVAYVAWPDRNEVTDALVTATVRGGTFMAYGGRLDWLSDIVYFFCEPLDGAATATQQFVREHNCFHSYETRIFSMPVTDIGKCQKGDVIRTFYSLDLLDVALCYEPGDEATMVANARAKNFARTQAGGAAQKSGSTELFSPVACVLAATSVRVSGNRVTDTKSQEYNIWVRDLAISLVDTTLRMSSIASYTSEALHQAGYVKVIGVAVMEANVRTLSKECLQWEIEVANNELRIDTCHDTTAALGRIVAQLQQLFAPEIEPSAIHMRTRKGLEKNDLNFDEPSICGKHEMNMDSVLESVNSDNVGIFASVLEDAFTLTRNNNSNSDDESSLHGLSHNSCSFQSGRAWLLQKVGVFNNEHEMQQPSAFTHDMQQPALGDCSCSQAPFQPTIYHDLQIPLTNDTGRPSFIENYYITKSNESPCCRCKNSRKLTSEIPGTSAHEKAEGKGGWYEDGFPKVLENHIPDIIDNSTDQRDKSVSIGQNNSNLGTTYPQFLGRIVFQGLNLHWRLYGGSDWPNTGIQGSANLMNQDRKRNLDVCLEVLLSGVDLQHDLFPEEGLYASRLVVSIQDVHVYDCSKHAPWKMILGYHRRKYQPRESSAKAAKVELEAVRPNPFAPFEEYRLSLNFSPMRLHLDQRHVDFLVEFFPSDSPPSIYQGHNKDELLSRNNATVEGLGSPTSEADDEALLPFFQVCDIHPFTIQVDYVPRRVDLTALCQGNYAELLNLVSWKGIELHLKHVRAAGVHGCASLTGTVVGKWLEDISQNQVHKLIKGLSPIRPLIAVGAGAAKLVVIPTQHYHRDQHLLREMKKGAIAFIRSVSLEAIGLGLHLAAGAHDILLHAESALTPSMPCAVERRDMSSLAIQPGDTREGFQQACESLTFGLERTATSLIGNPVKIYQRGAGASFAVVSAIRAAPAAALAPASGAAGAVHRALLGIRNGLDPEHKRESEEKYLGYLPEF